MPKTSFRKFSATGNTFLVLETDPETLSSEARRKLCHPVEGLSADGLLALTPLGGAAFAMRYWNADGQAGSFCGNGARVATWLAYEATGHKELWLHFGENRYPARLISEAPPVAEVGLQVHQPPCKVTLQVPTLATQEAWLADTGSPHALLPVAADRLESLDIAAYAHQLIPQLAPLLKQSPQKGINVSFFAPIGEKTWAIRTYERGVWAETLSCGTASVALATILHRKDPEPIEIQARGGKLKVKAADTFFWLTGPLQEVLRGTVEWT
ncbi:MAG: diaminopimelate epimerase [Bacteroidia bacterium]|nr:MAG: diaminopimelate epimerase [Bacteroidia bacterium]